MSLLSTLIVIIPLAISLGTLVLAIINSRGKAEVTFVDQLKYRIDDLDKRMKACEDARKILADKNADLQDQNLQLLQKVVASVVSDKINNNR